MPSFVEDRAQAIVALIKAYHDHEGGDGDSCIYFKYDDDNKLFDKVIMIIRESKLYDWIYDPKESFVAFNDGSNDNCFLTKDKSFFDNQPSWVGLKIEI